MRLLLDEDAGWLDLKKALVAAGHDVVRSVDILGNAAPDEDVLKTAIGDGRVLVTFNGTDFLQLAARYPKHPGMLFIYRDNLPSDMKMKEIVAAIGNVQNTYDDLNEMSLNLNAFN